MYMYICVCAESSVFGIGVAGRGPRCKSFKRGCWLDLRRRVSSVVDVYMYTYLQENSGVEYGMQVPESLLFGQSRRALESSGDTG